MCESSLSSFEKNKKRLKDKVIPMPPDGQELAVLAGKPIDDGKRGLYLFSPPGEGRYFLKYVEAIGDTQFKISPYEGADTEELILELSEKYVATAYDE